MCSLFITGPWYLALNPEPGWMKSYSWAPTKVPLHIKLHWVGEPPFLLGIRWPNDRPVPALAEGESGDVHMWLTGYEDKARRSREHQLGPGWGWKGKERPSSGVFPVLRQMRELNLAGAACKRLQENVPALCNNSQDRLVSMCLHDETRNPKTEMRPWHSVWLGLINVAGNSWDYATKTWPERTGI